MSASLVSLEARFRRGHFRDILEELGPQCDASSLPVEHALLYADVLARTGNGRRAREIASRLELTQLSPASRARCEFVMGLAMRELGASEEALRRLRKSAQIASSARDLSLAGLASLMAYRTLSERHARTITKPVLDDIRQLVTAAGDAHLSALLHESVARQETQEGYFTEARRHLRIATGLLGEHPSAWLEQNCAISAFCIDFSSGDFHKAGQHLERASRLVSRTAAFEGRLANNLGHLHLHLGNPEAAVEVLSRVVREGSGDLLQCGLEGRAKAFLSLGQHDDCEADLWRLKEVHASDGEAVSLAFRESLITFGRLRIAQRRWAEALEATDVAKAAVQRVQDRQLLGAARFLRGIALAALGRRHESAEEILGAEGRFPREYLPHFADLSAEHLAVDPEEAQAHRQCSARVRSAYGHAGKPNIETISTDAIRLSGTAVLGDIAQACEFGGNPRLLGLAVISLIDATIGAHHARIEDSAPAAGSTLAEGHLFLGKEGARSLSIRYRVPNEPEKALRLVNVMNIVKVLLELEGHRESERNRAALLPADRVEKTEGSIFVAEEMQHLIMLANRVAPTTVPVLITGETGTGKEVLARIIHGRSNRANGPFVPFNCTSTPKDMLDSQLFGHRRGAFTGATDHFPGVIRAANNGTLFLDEIGDMGLEVQPKILRFLEAREVHPIGDTQPRTVDVRVIAATNVPLDSLVVARRFREDLFYRLNIVHLHVPPLRNRRVEIPTLAQHYIKRYADEYRKGDLRLSEEAIEYLVLYRWPGNVRQLANEMRRMAALSESSAVLMPEHLSGEIAATRRTVPASQRELDPNEVAVRLDQPLPAAIQHLERALLQYALRKAGGRMEETAALLGVSRKGLYLKRQRFGIDPPRDGTADVA